MKYLSLLSLFIFINISVYAQIPQVLDFEETVYDYGVIKQEDGQVPCQFKYKNNTGTFLTIEQVSTSCGCTVGQFKKTRIAPKEEGTITITYDASKKPGNFMQTAVVQFVEVKEVISLYIKGNVIPRIRTKNDIYPIPIGNLRFVTTHLSFHKISTDTIVTDTMKVFNDWYRPMTLQMQEIPEFLTVRMPSVLDAQKEGNIIITYNTAKRQDYGLVFDRLSVVTNDTIMYLKTFHVSAEINEDFGDLDLNDLKNAPNMVFDEEVFEFDSIPEGEVIKKVFNFKNTGVNKLYIRKIATSCGCTASEVSSNVINGGEEGSITVIFNSRQKKGPQRQTIKIITNNPHRPTIKLVMQGYVIPKIH